MTCVYKFGLYEVEITSQGLAKVGDNNNPCCVLGFRVDGRIDEADPTGMLIAAPAGEGKITLYLTEKAAPFSIKNLMSLGWNGVALKELDPSNPNHHSLIGTKTILSWKESHKGGDDDWEFPRASAQAVENTPGLGDELDRSLAKLLVKPSRPAATTRTRAPQPIATPDKVSGDTPDDEVPF
jgi:hypothetical protein